MADFILFNEGAPRVLDSGFSGASACVFDLCTKKVSEYTAATKYSERAAATGTGYTQKTQTAPAASGGSKTFSEIEWSTGSATNWPSNCASVCLSIEGKLVAAWNLQAGGAARAMNAASTTEKFTPTFTIA